jgi:hypothetical protein
MPAFFLSGFLLKTSDIILDLETLPRHLETLPRRRDAREAVAGMMLKAAYQAILIAWS